MAIAWLRIVDQVGRHAAGACRRAGVVHHMIDYAGSIERKCKQVDRCLNLARRHARIENHYVGPEVRLTRPVGWLRRRGPRGQDSRCDRRNEDHQTQLPEESIAEMWLAGTTDFDR